MNTQDNPFEVKTNESAEVKKEYQMPIFNELGSVADLTAGGKVGSKDGNFSGTAPF